MLIRKALLCISFRLRGQTLRRICEIEDEVPAPAELRASPKNVNWKLCRSVRSPRWPKSVLYRDCIPVYTFARLCVPCQHNSALDWTEPQAIKATVDDIKRGTVLSRKLWLVLKSNASFVGLTRGSQTPGEPQPQPELEPEPEPAETNLLLPPWREDGGAVEFLAQH